MKIILAAIVVLRFMEIMEKCSLVLVTFLCGNKNAFSLGIFFRKMFFYTKNPYILFVLKKLAIFLRQIKGKLLNSKYSSHNHEICSKEIFCNVDTKIYKERILKNISNKEN